MTTAIRQAESPTTLLIPIGALIVAMLSFTSGASVAKQLFPIVGPQGTTALRLSIGALILIAVLRALARTALGHVLAIGRLHGLAMGGMNLLFYMSIQRLPLGIAIALEFTGPLTVAILSSRRKIDLLWVALAAGGLSLLLPLGDGIANVDPIGAVLALGAGACWALYIIAGKRAGQEHGTLATSLGMVVAALAVVPIGFAHAGTALFQPDVLLIGTVVAVLSSAFPYTLEMFALRHLPAQTYGTLTSGEPAAGAMVGLFLLGEALPLLQWCAIAMIVAASVGATMTAMRSQSTPEPLNLG